MRSALLAALVTSGIAPTGRAQSVPAGERDTVRLTIVTARAAAVTSNPELMAARADIHIARGQLRQAGILRFNPGADILGVGHGGIPEIGLSQEIEVGGQRGLRQSSARAGVTRARFSVMDVARLTLAEVDRTFYRAVAADRRVALARNVLTLSERLAQVATKQLQAGEISKLDYNLSAIELGRSRARALAARREQEQSVIELRRITGFPATAAVVAVFDSTVHHHTELDSTGSSPRVDLASFGVGDDTTVAALVDRALRLRPDLAERIAAVSQASTDVALSRREAVPNLAARVVSEQSSNASGTMVRPGLGITLPLFNRNQGEVEARRARARQSTLERAAVATRVRADVESALRAFETAAGEVELFERTVLQPARDNIRLLETAYREGKVGLPVLLLIRNQVSDAEQDYWTSWLAERTAAADLTAALGLNIPADTSARP